MTHATSYAASEAVEQHAPALVNGKNTRKTNAELRPREYLLPAEVDALITAARQTGRHGKRNALMIELMYRHGLRVGELVDLEWAQFDLAGGFLHVRRLKNGRDSTHPVAGPTLRHLKALKRSQGPNSRWVFLSARGTPLEASGVRKLVRSAGGSAALPFPVHPHMLRHACGYYLASRGVDTRTIQEYLGHSNITHTVRYTALSAKRFEGLWR